MVEVAEREQLEQAIAALEAQRTILGDAVVDASITALREKLAALEPAPTADQRKQVTVLFADVYGFTAMSETLDAEDVTEIMNALWERLDKAITDHGGQIDKHMGDSVMAIWGAETAREDDPERAIHAALAMQKEIGSWESAPRSLRLRVEGLEVGETPNLQIRIGINTGPVLLGEVGTTGEYTAVGDTVNTASRLEQAAPVGGILISHDTYRHVRGAFTVRLLEPIRVKGKAELPQVYLVQRAKPRAFRVGWRGVEGVETRMIGREGELKQLQDALYAAMEDGERQMVTISGEAGVGKSRLLHEFVNWMELLPQDVYYFKGRASPEMQNVPYALIRDLFVFRFQIRDSDQARVVREKMERGIGEAPGETRPEPGRRDEQGQMMAQTRAHFIGQLLGFDFSDSPHLRGVLDDAQQLRDRALMYLSDYFKARAAQLPTVILLEDIHWADDSSLDVLNHLALTTPNQRLLFVCLARPTLFERLPHWGEGQTFHTHLELRPLPKRDSRRLVEEILQRVGQVPVALRELVVGGAEGNPLYVEELIKMLIEDGVILTEAERWRVQPIRLTTIRVPATLTGVLQARLDSLPQTERTTVQQASVVGRTFWDSAVLRIGQSAGGAAGQEVPAALSVLRGKEMIFQREPSAFAGTREYIFKHAILREVTYESVLKRLRRVYHGLVADWLMEQGGERAGEYTGLIAEHLELAGQREKAVIYLRRAGEQAAAAFANAEAVAYLTRALELTPRMDHAERYAILLAREKVYDLQGEREAQRVDLTALGQLAEALDSPSTALRQAQDDSSGQAGRRAEVAVRQANYASVTGDYPAAIAAAQQAIALVQEAGVAESEAAKETEGAALGGLGRASWVLGQVEKAVVYLEKALTIAREIGDKRSEGMHVRSLGRIYCDLGQMDKSTSYLEEALTIAREIGDKHGQSQALAFLGRVHYDMGQMERAISYCELALTIAREIGDKQSQGAYLNSLGNFCYEFGQLEKAFGYYESAMTIAREIGDKRREAQCAGNLGNVCSDMGQMEKAFDHYEESLNIARAVGDKRTEGLVLGILGHACTVLKRYTDAVAHLREGIDILKTINLPLGLCWLGGYLGWALLASGRLDEARAAFDEAAVMDVPDGNYLASVGLGVACLRLEDEATARKAFSEAVERCEALLAETPELREACYALGLARAGLAALSAGDMEEAVATYRRGRAICDAVGVLDEARRKLDELGQAGRGDLNVVRAVLVGGG